MNGRNSFFSSKAFEEHCWGKKWMLNQTKGLGIRRLLNFIIFAKAVCCFGGRYIFVIFIKMGGALLCWKASWRVDRWCEKEDFGGKFLKEENVNENMRWWWLLFFFYLAVERARCKNVGYFVVDAFWYQMEADIWT